MHYFIKNIRKFIVISSLALVILGALGYASLSLQAELPFDPKEEAAKSADEYADKKAQGNLGDIDIESIAFPNDKQGCATKSAMFFAMSLKYKSGENIEDVITNKIFAPLIEGVYEKINKNGFETATLNNMKDYQSCIAAAKPNKNPSKEYDLALKHNACGKLNAALLETLYAIKQRQSVGMIISKYENVDADFYDTPYAEIQNPIMLLVGRLYQSSKNQEYEESVQMASAISVACYGS